MDSVTIKFLFENNTEASFSDIIDFRFVRERYTPYTVLSGHFLSSVTIQNVKTVYFYLNNHLIHVGMPDYLQRKYTKGRSLISFMSRSYTMLLGQNEPVPGIISNTDLTDLISCNTSIPYITCQNQTQRLNYVYVKEKSTIWDAVCAYSYKAYQTYPYIYNTNTVRVTPPDNVTTHTYENDTITSYGEKLSTSGLYSHVYMADIDGQYIYGQINNDAVARDIVKKKYYRLDEQWYYNPDDGLLSKLKYSNKGYISRSFEYKGHKFENLQDRVSFTGNSFSINNELIAGVEVKGNSHGIFTVITVYRDSYS